MSEIAYTVVWTPQASADLQELDPNDATDVLNNTFALARTPYPPFSGKFPGEDMFALIVERRVSVTYEIIGLTVRILAITYITKR